MHFDVVDLRLFVHIADTHSLTRGAERAHLSVPAATIRIKNLDCASGCRATSCVPSARAGPTSASSRARCAPRGLEVVPYRDDRLVLAVSGHHALASRRSVHCMVEAGVGVAILPQSAARRSRAGS